VQQNDISGAKSDLDSIRLRAGLPASTLNDKSGLLSLILHERQVELFTEWGHRWLDLKRTSIIDNVMTTVTPQKSGGSPWQPYQQWYPIPFYDLQRDQNLIQNNGY
jgi:hypothetical protein